LRLFLQLCRWGSDALGIGVLRNSNARWDNYNTKIAESEAFETICPTDLRNPGQLSPALGSDTVKGDNIKMMANSVDLLHSVGESAF